MDSNAEEREDDDDSCNGTATERQLVNSLLKAKRVSLVAEALAKCVSLFSERNESKLLLAIDCLLDCHFSENSDGRDKQNKAQSIFEHLMSKVNTDVKSADFEHNLRNEWLLIQIMRNYDVKVKRNVSDILLLKLALLEESSDVSKELLVMFDKHEFEQEKLVPKLQRLTLSNPYFGEFVINKLNHFVFSSSKKQQFKNFNFVFKDCLTEALSTNSTSSIHLLNTLPDEELKDIATSDLEFILKLFPMNSTLPDTDYGNYFAALIGRSTCKLSHKLEELQWNVEKENNSSINLYVDETSKNFKIENCFYASAFEKKHFLSEIISIDLELFDMLPDRIKLVYLLDKLYYSSTVHYDAAEYSLLVDKLQELIESEKETVVHSDAVLDMLVNNLNWIFGFAEWCTSKLSLPSSENLRVTVFKNFSNCDSPLNILRKNGILNLLTSSDSELCDDVSSLLAEYQNDTQLMLWYGYMAVKLSMEAIWSALAQKENEVFENSMVRIKNYLEKLFPLTFRVEVLENLYSLLFVTVNELMEEKDLEGDEYEYCNDSCTNTGKNTSDFGDNSTVENRNISSSRNLSLLTMISFHLSGGLINFLFPSEFVPHFLTLLKDVVIETQTTLFVLQRKTGSQQDTLAIDSKQEIDVKSSIRDLNECKVRLNVLRENIIEAQWRYAVIEPTFVKKKRECSKSNEGSDSEDTEDTEPLDSDHSSKDECDSSKQREVFSSVIPCMLASPDQLLRYCLIQDKIDRAKQVYRLFEQSLNNTEESYELLVIVKYNELITKLKAFTSKKKSSLTSKVPETSSKGLQKSEIQSLLHEFYASINSESGGKVDSKRLLVDFALTSSPSLLLSQIILETSNQEKCNVGCEKLELLLNRLSSMIFLLLRQEDLKEELSYILSYSLDEELFQKPHLIRDENEKQNNLKSCVLNLKSILFGDAEETNASSSTSPVVEARKLTSEYQKLLNVCPTGKLSYLKALFIHVRRVSKALTECKKRSESFSKEVTGFDREMYSFNHANGTYFSVLYNSPSVTLCSMILKHGISPKVVDDLAKDMRVDLLETLCSLHSPFIPSVVKDDLDFELVDSFHPALCELIQCYLTGSQSNNESVYIQNHFDDDSEPGVLDRKYAEKIQNPELIEYFRLKSWILIEILDLLKLLKPGILKRGKEERFLKNASPLINWISVVRLTLDCGSKEDPVMVRAVAMHPKLPASHVVVMKCLEKFAQNKDLVKIYELLRFMDVKNPSSSFVALRTAILSKLTFETQNVKFALQIDDFKTKSDLVLRTVMRSDSYYDTNIALSALKSVSSILEASNDYHRNFSSTLDEIKFLMDKINCYAKIGELAGLRSWKNALNDLTEIDILTILKTRKAYSLVLDWNELQAKDEVLDSETEELKLELLSLAYCEKNDRNLLEEVLVKSENCVALVEKLLPQVDDWESKCFLISFIVSNETVKKDSEKLDFYSKYMIGVKLINILPSTSRSQYIPLCTQPNLIVEQMLMNMEFDALEKSLKTLQLINCDDLIEKYAKKAVDIEVVDNISLADSDTTMISSSILNDNQSAIFLMPATVPTMSQWIPDNRVTYCMLCRIEKFSMFNRRHHCRRCGRVVCATCSHNVLVIPEVTPYAAVRVCDDCFAQTKARSPRKESMSSLSSSTKILQWILTLNDTQNEAVRNEFYYESAPSSSLCLSILKLHTDNKKCSNVIIEKFCKPLFEILSSNQVDYGLVISTVKSLLLSAKVLTNEEDSASINKINFLLAQIDIIKMLVNENCLDRGLIGYVINDENAFLKLQEKLIEMERFELALNIAMKFGINLKPIWKTWAVVCFKNFKFAEARIKYKYCFVQKTSGEAIATNSKLLEEMFDIMQKLKSKWSTGSSLRAKCKAIKAGQCLAKDNNSSSLPPFLMNEAFYYLEAYGSKEDVIKFYVRFDMYKNAVETLIADSNSLSLNSTFIYALLIPSLNRGSLKRLLNIIHMLDPSLCKTWKYLLLACKYLSQNSYYEVLHTIQVFMGDYIRAAITQINFFYLYPPALDYSQLYHRKDHLILAKQHCRDFLNNIAHLHKGCFMMSSTDVRNQIRTIDLQLEISSKFHEKGVKGFLEVIQESEEFQAKGVPTLLDHSKARKTVLAALVAVECGSSIFEGFTLSQQIIKDHCLDSAHVFRLSGRTIISTYNSVDMLSNFLGCIRACLPPEESIILCDDIVGACIRSCNNNSLMEPLIKLLTSDVNKIDSYIQCNKLKSAYLLAVRLDRVVDVQKIHSLAVRTNQEKIKQISEAFLKKFDKST